MRILFTILILSFSALTSFAQKSVEVGLFLGASNYFGEINSDWDRNNKFAFGLVGRYNPNPYISLRGSVFYGTIGAADSTTGVALQRDRNLSFQSPIFEFGAQGEWNIFGFDPAGNKGKAFTPFLFGGVAVFKFNPRAYFEEEWVELQPLGTEGQGTTPLQERKKYNLTTWSVPFGFGFKARITPRLSMAFEYGWRLTGTDYIDDVSTTYVDPQILEGAYGYRSAELSDRSRPEIRAEHGPYDILTGVGDARGNPDNKDWYTFAGFTFTYTINLKRTKCYSF